MLGVTKLAPGQERYHLRAVGLDGSAGEPPGSWVGRSAGSLGVSGAVEGAALSAVLGGRHPVTGAQLRDLRYPVRVPGFELTFGAPKSVSVLGGLCGGEVAAEVDGAQASAVGAAVGYLEREAARARRAAGGQRRLVPVDGLVAAAFTHHTSRGGDPHLHTHVLVANLVRGEDGRWSALEAGGLFAHATTAASLHAAQLRSRLTNRLGLAWARHGDGGAQVAGIDPSLLRAFSRRRAEVETRMAEHGATSAR
ncbi:MAG TPA: MobF family relaxase, partial [Acidimicrobiales bacterium]|nr:MobF family relaxase [Acidimicrobiales bacterium]